MAKNDQKQARQTANENAAKTDVRTQDQNTQIQSQQQNAQSQQGQTFQGAQQGFTQAQTTGGFDPNALDKIRSTGGYDPNALDQMRKQISTGGYDPNALSSLRSTAQQFTGSGGYDPAQTAKVTGGYSNFADTGGFTDASANAFRREGNSSVPAIYNVLQQEADRRRALTGGTGSDETSQLARQLAQQSASTDLSTENALQKQINTNKLSGLEGLSSLATNQAAGRRSGLDTQQRLEGSVADNTLRGSQDLEGDIAKGRRETEANVAHGSVTASGGLSQLYNTATGEVSDMGRQILTNFGLQDASHDQQTRVLTQLANTPGVLDNILKIAGTAGSVATGAAGLGYHPFTGAGGH